MLHICIIRRIDFSDLSIEPPASCSGRSSVSSRRHAVACKHWSSSSLAPASESGRYLDEMVYVDAATSGRKKTCLSSLFFLLWLNSVPGGPVSTLCPSRVYQLTPAELAHRVPRFGQTPKQHLLPVGVRRLSQLVLWRTEGETEKLKTIKKDSDRCRANELCEENAAMQQMKSLTPRTTADIQLLTTEEWWGAGTHRCQRPPPPCRWRLWSSGDR